MENDERWPGRCLPEGTPYKPELQNDSDEAMYAYLKKKFKDESSDKENSIKETKKSPKKVSFSDKNGIKSPRKDVSPKKEVKLDINDMRQKLNTCTGDKNCPVHCMRTRPQWSFYGMPENIEMVINALNKRGFREGELRHNLMQEATSLSGAIAECPRHKLNPEVVSIFASNLKSRSSLRLKTLYQFSVCCLFYSFLVYGANKGAHQ